MRYAFVIEKAQRNYSAYAFDLPGRPAQCGGAARAGADQHCRVCR